MRTKPKMLCQALSAMVEVIALVTGLRLSTINVCNIPTYSGISKGGADRENTSLRLR